MESTRGGTKQTALVERFVATGMTIVRFDFSFVGDSGGNFEDLTVSGEVDDLHGALDFVASLEPRRCVVLGSSLGGTVALLGAAERPELVDAVATIAAVADASLFTLGLSAADKSAWRHTGTRKWRDGLMRSSFLDDVEGLDVLASVKRLACPLLIMHGDRDDVVPLAHAELIAGAAAGPTTLRVFPGVGHRFEEPGALDALLDCVDEWLSDDLGVTGDG
jgi:putative redox protein